MPRKLKNSLKILDEIYLGNKEDLSELNGALDELKNGAYTKCGKILKIVIWTDRQSKSTFDKEIEPIRVKTDICHSKGH